MPSARSRGIALMALLAAAGSAGVWLVGGRSSSSARSVESASVVGRTPEMRRAMLENSLRAIADGVRDAPRDRWDPAYIVQQVGRNPDSLVGWVRENTSWIPYRGVLRGAVGVLMDRKGNNLDRAMLLAALLAEAGHATRLARAEMPADRALLRLPTVAGQRPSMALDEPASPDRVTPPVRDVAAGYELDGAEIERVLEEYESGTARLLAELGQRVPAQATRLLSSISAPDPEAEWLIRRDTALAALRDHWWVQVRDGESWVDLDPIAESSPGPDFTPITPLETVSPSDLAPSLHHEIAIRVIEERLTGGELRQRRTLAHPLRPSALIGQSIVLQFWPAAWPNRAPSTDDQSRTTRQLASEQEEWNAALVIGSDVVANATLAASASFDEQASGLGGLGGAIAQGLDGRREPAVEQHDSLLTAVWIEYQISVPGRESRLIRRRVFDLIGEAARESWAPGGTVALSDEHRLTRGLSLMMRTEILPVVAQFAPEFVLHLGGRSILANADLIRGVGREGFGSDQHAADSLLRLGEPGVSPLYTLAVLRHDALGGLGFIDRPAVLTRHQYPTTRGDSVRLEDATDIVANEVGIALAESDGFAARLAQGVWDTNLEALLAGSRASANTALAYAASENWRVFASGQRARGPAELAADAAALLRRDLESGYTVVAPDAPLVLQGEEFAGWWRIDSETGDALGIAGTGWGQAAPDYTLHLAAFAEMAKPFVFTYALCQYIPQAANSLNIIGYEFWRRGLAPRWTTPVDGKEFEDLAAENNRRCLIEAITAGFVATAPILLLKMQAMAYRTEAELAGGARLPRRPGVTLPGIERPPGTSPRPQGYPAPSAPAPSQGPRGTLPGGSRPPTADPLGRTVAGRSNTPPGPATAGSNPLENLRSAAAAERAAKIKSGEATGDWVRYRHNMPPSEPDPRWRGDPSRWNQSGDDALRQRMRETQKEWYARQKELEAAQKAARDAAGAATRAPQIPAAPNPANVNPTVPGVQAPAPAPNGALEVGSVGAASAFYPFSWTSGLGQ